MCDAYTSLCVDFTVNAEIVPNAVNTTSSATCFARHSSWNIIQAKVATSQLQGGKGSPEKVRRFGRDELLKAMTDLRLANASSKVIDIGGSIQQSRKDKVAATRRLEEIVEESKWALKSWEKSTVTANFTNGTDLAARVTMKCAPGQGNKGVMVGVLNSRFELGSVLVPSL